ncbi:MAG: 4Fe-4S ferredoxin iron-sulfur binding domain protein [Bacillota bacterium]|jgi:ferredoxin-NADP reductase/NAD-dependent dihydropyrimidine dehydrogenase PreA subunit|nr:4Fe-4S ferredoxin iron-sulfur binding domain protein [Bacillota bacterium]
MAKFDAILTPNPVLPNHVIKIDPAKCIACYQCAQICRCNVLMENPEKGQPPVLVYPEECWHCAVCTENCPTGAIEFDHPINQKITWKRKATGELFRIGMKNAPAPYQKRACGDRNVYLEDAVEIEMTAAEATKISRYVVKARLEKRDQDIPRYEPGNFCNVKVGDNTYRGYSFGNAYNGRWIELYIDIFPGGPGSRFFDALTTGVVVQVSMPYGKFIYKSRTTPVLLIGSVTGISPLKALLEKELKEIRSGRKIELLFQVWDVEDVFLAEYFDWLAAEHENFTWRMIYANPKCTNEGSGAGGINAYIESAPFITKDMDVYMCGSKALVKSAEALLLARGVFWRNIFYESFLA